MKKQQATKEAVKTSKTTAKAKQVTSKATAKQSVKEAVKTISEAKQTGQKQVIYLADGITKGMLNKSLKAINDAHKLDMGGYMYCLKRWLHFAELLGKFSEFRNITPDEIREARNLAEFRTESEKERVDRTGKYSVYLIGRLVSRYAQAKG